MIHILMVEDDDDVRDSLVDFLRLNGLEVDGTGSAREFLAFLDRRSYDIAIIDIGLPDQDGFQLAQALKGRPRPGIVLFTARGSTEDRIRGFQCGADLYFVKPVDGRELLAALEALARRLEACPGDAVPRSWVFDLTRWTLRPPGGSPVALTATEVRFLQALLVAPGKVVARPVLMAALGYEENDAGHRSLEALIRRLRRKVEEATEDHSAIQTVHRQGYLFSAPVTVERP